MLLLNLEFAPDWVAEDDADGGPTVIAEPPPTSSAAAEAPKKTNIPAAARVPTIVARFSTESKEPVDDSGIKALARAMIEDHDTLVILEGHSDTLGAEDFNHDLSLERANLVKARLVALGISEERIETVGLGATRPLHSDAPDASSVNRRVEVRWVGHGDPSWRQNARDAGRPSPPPAPASAPVEAPRVTPDAAAPVATPPPAVVDASITPAPVVVVEAGAPSAPPVTPPESVDSGRPSNSE